MENIETVIVGGGQAGLSVGYYLQQQGRDFVILDANERIGDDGEPIHERGVVATEPGLYFVGLFFLSAATSSLVGGVGRDAAYIAEQIALRTRGSGVVLNRRAAARHDSAATPPAL